MSSPSQAELPPELRLLLDLEETTVEELEARLSKTGDAVETPEGLAVRLSGVSDAISLEDAKILVETMIAVWQISTGREKTPSEWIEERLQEADSELFATALHRLRKVVETRAVSLTARAVDLSMDQSHLVTRTRVLSDLRPLFSDEGQRVDAAVVIHTLQLTYRTAGLVEQLGLGLDETDLRRLIRQCERALNKSEAMRKEFCEESGVPTLRAAEVETEQ